MEITNGLQVAACNRCNGSGWLCVRLLTSAVVTGRAAAVGSCGARDRVGPSLGAGHRGRDAGGSDVILLGW